MSNGRTVLRTLLAQASPPRSDGRLAGIAAKNTERLIIVQIRLWILVFAIATVFSPSPWSAMLFHGGRETLAKIHGHRVEGKRSIDTSGDLARFKCTSREIV